MRKKVIPLPQTFDEQTNVRDYLLGLDDLQQPRVIDMSIIKPGEWNSAILFIARLILLVPGTYEDHPEMGIDIRGRYRFAFEDELHQLSEEIQEQIERYLPEFNVIGVTSQFEMRDMVGYIIIDIEVNHVIYRLLYNVDDNKLVGLEDL
jgi:hypothetical protein